tara:strand:+ start:14 stop:217 length:204 start_codon:yes stop_codon:yes gene_type:complete
MEGIKSRKVWVIAIETMNIAIGRGGTEVNSGIEREARRIAAIRLMWIPGNRPVRVPASRPRRTARKI